MTDGEVAAVSIAGYLGTQTTPVKRSTVSPLPSYDVSKVGMAASGMTWIVQSPVAHLEAGRLAAVPVERADSFMRVESIKQVAIAAERADAEEARRCVSGDGHPLGPASFFLRSDDTIAVAAQHDRAAGRASVASRPDSLVLPLAARADVEPLSRANSRAAGPWPTGRSVVNSVASGSGVGTGAGTVAATAAGDRRRTRTIPRSDQRDDQQAQQQHEKRARSAGRHRAITHRGRAARGGIEDPYPVVSRAGVSDTDRRNGRERRRVECDEVLVLEVAASSSNDVTTSPVWLATMEPPARSTTRVQKSTGWVCTTQVSTPAWTGSSSNRATEGSPLSAPVVKTTI